MLVALSYSDGAAAVPATHPESDHATVGIEPGHSHQAPARDMPESCHPVNPDN